MSIFNEPPRQAAGMPKIYTMHIVVSLDLSGNPDNKELDSLVKP